MHGVVVGQQHVFDRFGGNLRDARNQVLRHGWCGCGSADHDELVANDHARIRVTFSRVGPAVGT